MPVAGAGEGPRLPLEGFVLGGAVREAIAGEGRERHRPELWRPRLRLAWTGSIAKLSGVSHGLRPGRMVGHAKAILSMVYVMHRRPSFLRKS